MNEQVPSSHDLGRIRTNPLSGSENLRRSGELLSVTVLDFWRWSASDLVSNATRGRLAEFIVATALDVDLSGVRDEWSAYDLVTPAGIRVEVKSSAYLQSWAQKRLSKVTFSTRPSRSWDPERCESAKTPSRESDVYVFALLAYQAKETLDPLHLDQWEFYVLPTSILNRQEPNRRSISVDVLRRKHAGPFVYEAISTAVSAAHQVNER